VGLIEDADYRPRRCVLARLSSEGLALGFAAVPASHRLVGFAGFSYFLERDVTAPEVELALHRRGATLGNRRMKGEDGWARFELPGSAEPEDVEVSLRELESVHGDPCFALEAR
jgi:hypothetical protein